MASSTRDRADELLRDAATDPAAVVPRARALVKEIGETDHVALAVARRALGLAVAYTGQPASALDVLHESVAAAEASGDTDVLGGTLMTLGFVQASAGLGADSHTSMERAVSLLEGGALGQALTQRGALLLQVGDGTGALADFDAAVPLLQEADDRRWEARLLGNRAVVWANRGDFTRAEADLLSARQIFESLGETSHRAWVTHNLGWAAARAGDLPAALTYLADAEAELSHLGLATGEVLRDRCDALLAAQLAAEARVVATAAVREFDKAGWESAKAEALIRLARAAILQRDYPAAAEAAATARRLFLDQDRTTWAAGSMVLAVEARRHAGDIAQHDLGEAAVAAADLDAAGYVLWADEARLVETLVACDLGRADVAVTTLETVSPTSKLPPELSVRLALARARTADLGGDRATAGRHLARGLRLVEDIQSQLGSSETRVHVAALRTELAALGMRLAMDRGGARHVLDWIERARAASLRYPSVRDTDGDSEKLSQIRVLESVLRSGEAPDPAAVSTQLASVKAALARDSRRSQGSGRLEPRVPTAEIVDAVGGRVLVEIGVADGRLVRVVVHGGRARLRTLGSAEDAEFEADATRFALQRLTTPGHSPESRAAAAASLHTSVTRLREMLLTGVPDGEGPLIVVPPPSLHAVPWSVMVADRPVTVAPSADLWVRRNRERGRLDRVVIADGPDLEHAAAESACIGAIYPEATVLSGSAATPGAVLTGMDGADVVHLACHGSFNPENPLFTALTFAGGSVTVHDIEQLATPPRLVVLSACDAGLPAERPGEEILGIVSALLGMGTKAVVAGIGLVPDAAPVISLMENLHAGLHSGLGPAGALARAQKRSLADETAMAAAASFVCFGAG